MPSLKVSQTDVLKQANDGVILGAHEASTDFFLIFFIFLREFFFIFFRDNSFLSKGTTFWREKNREALRQSEPHPNLAHAGGQPMYS